MAEPIGDDEETFRRGLAESRAALGRARPRPVVVPDPEDESPEPTSVDDRDARIAELEAENRRLRRTLDRIRTALDP